MGGGRRQRGYHVGAAESGGDAALQRSTTGCFMAPADPSQVVFIQKKTHFNVFNSINMAQYDPAGTQYESHVFTHNTRCT